MTPPEDERARYRAAHHQARRRLPSPLIGALLLIVAIVGPYIAFSKHIPFTGHGYELTATFHNAVAIAPKSPVRIAGVDVGEVLDTSSAGRNTDVHFTVDEDALPVSADAQVKIRPRIFLEGNYFLELDPGSPSAPELASGETIPVGQTATAVQFDEILTALQAPQRNQLGRLLEGYGTALTHQPTAAEDETQDPRVRGLSAAEALNLSFDSGAKAGRAGSQVAEAFLGTEPHDLSLLISGAARTFGAVSLHEQQLRDLVSNWNRFTGALAAESVNLGRTLDELPETLETTRSSLANLSRTLPVLRRWALELRPALAELPATIDAANPWLAQAQPLLSKPEAGGLVEHDPARDPGPRRRERGRPDHAAGDLAAQPLHDGGPDPDRQPGDRGPLLHRAAELPGVLLHHRQPRRREPELRRQRPVPAPAARHRGSDRHPERPEREPGDGQDPVDAHDAAAAGNPARLRTEAALPAGRQMPPERRPRPQRRARWRRAAQPSPDGDRAMSPRAPENGSHWRAVLRRQLRGRTGDFLAVCLLVIAGLAVALGILSQQKAALPSWVPFFGQEFFHLEAEFSSAQAVTPGQGQAVVVAGIQIGKIDSVRVEDGHAVVGMDIEPEYAPLIHPDARLLLRPKTNLNDMVVEVDAGQRPGQLPDGTTIPLSRTQANVNPDELLATLDADTRAYLTLLLQGGAEGIGGRAKGVKLSAGLRRIEPFTRYTAQLTGALAKRRGALARVVHDFGLLTDELGRRDSEIARFIDASSAALGGFADRQADIREALRELPPTLEETRSSLASADELSEQLRPTLTGLIPQAQALGPALRSTTDLPRTDHGAAAHAAAPVHPGGAAPDPPRDPDGRAAAAHGDQARQLARGPELRLQRARLQPGGAQARLPLLPAVAEPRPQLDLRVRRTRPARCAAAC